MHLSSLASAAGRFEAVDSPSLETGKSRLDALETLVWSSSAWLGLIHGSATTCAVQGARQDDDKSLLLSVIVLIAPRWQGKRICKGRGE